MGRDEQGDDTLTKASGSFNNQAIKASAIRPSLSPQDATQARTDEATVHCTKRKSSPISAVATLAVEGFKKFIAVRARMDFHTPPGFKSKVTDARKQARVEIAPSTADTVSQLVKMEGREKKSEIVLHGNEAPIQPVPRHLLSPPMELVECMYPDTFVFPPKTCGTSPPGHVPSILAATIPGHLPCLFPSSTSVTIDGIFELLCEQGFYLPGESVWAAPSNVPNLLAEHHKATELDIEKFLNTLIDKAVDEVQRRTKQKPPVIRKWTAENACSRMPGCPEDRKPDLAAISEAGPPDWRAVDCIIEVKNGETHNETAFYGQLSERARTLFSVQDARRFAILIRIRRDEFSYTVFDRGGSIMAPFLKVHAFPKIFLRLILGIAFADRRFIGYDTSIYGQGASRRVKLDLASHEQGLRDLELQLVLHMTAKVNSRGSTIRLLKVAGDQVADFYGHSGDGCKSPPGMKLGKPFGIVCKDTWEEPHDELSEGCILQLLHAKGVHGVLWCLDEKPVIVPDAPPLPSGVETTESYMPQSFFDNTLYSRSRWGIRVLRVSHMATSAIWQKEKKALALALAPMLGQPKQGGIVEPKANNKGNAEGKVNGTGTGTESGDPNNGRETGEEKQPHPLSPPSDSIQRSTSINGSSLSATDYATVSTKLQPDGQYTMRCHLRSYMYPVGTPIFWFGSVLELLCVLRDLIRTHQEACSSIMDGKKTKLRMLHRDLSIWNLMMVSQARSDWPVDRQWHSTDLQNCWIKLDSNIRSHIRRGLLIDWGFAAVERVGGDSSSLTSKELKVYRPTERILPSTDMNVVLHEDDTIRHCLTGQWDPGDRGYHIPPLWKLEGQRISEMNTQSSPVSAIDGLVPTDWVNDVLNKDVDEATSATGTWPFVCMDVMTAWMLGKHMAIQPLHDLETLSISFTALCIWFSVPYCAKEVDADGSLAWIFEPHKESDTEAAYRKWNRFRNGYKDEILGKLSGQLDCPAIINLLTSLRNMCFPISWGDENDRSPSGFVWPMDTPRITHEKMLDAVEAAILTLLKDPPSPEHLSRNNAPPLWKSCHADVDDDGIFHPPPEMQKTTPPVVVDGVNSGRALGTIGVFDRVRSVSPNQEANGSLSDQHLSATASSTSKDHQRWLLRFKGDVKQPKRKCSTRGAEQIWGLSQARTPDSQKKRRFN
ncbi:hypothetical protein BDR03DRAFT_1018992 [Suillus americanus]|nr:hypothetical protein BDR03DRAFT_1018992 [Suillus americanus]